MTMPSRTWMSRRGRRLWLLALAAAAGCGTTDKTEVLESRLRQQEELLSSYQAQLDRAKTELDVARRETEHLRSQLSGKTASVVPVEAMQASFQVSGVAFSSLMTGGTDFDGRPGDDGLVVVLVPQDAAGELVKVPAKIDIEAFDLSHPSGAKRIGHWQFDVGESQRHWHKGVIQSGYQFQLPWQEPPTTDEVLVHGRLVAPDGRQFDTTHTVRIDPPPAASVTGNSRVEGNRPVDLSGRIEHVSVDAERRTAPSATEPVKAAPPKQPVWSLESSLGSVKAGVGSRGNGRNRPETESPDRRTASPPFEVRGISHLTDGNSPPPLPSSRRPSAGSQPRQVVSSADPWNGAVDRTIPPPIQGAPEEPEVTEPFPPMQIEPLRRLPVRTSDSWTDETIPYRR